MTGHGSCGVIQYNEYHIGLIINGINNTCDCRCKKSRVADECETSCIGFNFFYPLCNIQSGTHTQTGINHVERHGISKCVTANIPTENSFLSLHSFFDRVERSTVRTSGTEYRRTDRKFRRYRKSGVFPVGKAEKSINIGSYAVSGIFSGTGSVSA